MPSAAAIPHNFSSQAVSVWFCASVALRAAGMPLHAGPRYARAPLGCWRPLRPRGSAPRSRRPGARLLQSGRVDIPPAQLPNTPPTRTLPSSLGVAGMSEAVAPPAQLGTSRPMPRGTYRNEQADTLAHAPWPSPGCSLVAAAPARAAWSARAALPKDCASPRRLERRSAPTARRWRVEAAPAPHAPPVGAHAPRTSDGGSPAPSLGPVLVRQGTAWAFDICGSLAVR